MILLLAKSTRAFLFDLDFSDHRRQELHLHRHVLTLDHCVEVDRLSEIVFLLMTVDESLECVELALGE